MIDKTIEEADERLVTWVKSVVDKSGDAAEVSLDLSPPSAGKTRVSVYLMQVIPKPVVRAQRDRETFTLDLRYLVTSWGADLKAAHRILGDLMFAALKLTEMEIENEAVPPSIWQGFGLGLRPSFSLRVPVQQVLTVKLAPKVQKSVIFHGPKQPAGSPLAPLFGHIVWPEGIDVPDARIEMPSLKLSTHLDAQGRFYFPDVPLEPPVNRVLVHAKGRQINVSPVRRPPCDQPLLIKIKKTQL